MRRDAHSDARSVACRQFSLADPVVA